MPKKCCIHAGDREHVDDMLRSLLIREGDTVGMNFMKYKDIALDVFRDMNLNVIKDTKRYFIEVDKRTNTITIPDGFLFRSSLSVVDECNQIIQIAANPSIVRDIVDIAADKDCHCECGCKGSLCGQIAKYEPILHETQELMPNGSTQTFTSTTIKKVNPDGSFVIERTMPVRKYGTDGVWLGVELDTQTESLCQLEVKDCGCVKETEKNICAVNACCNAATFESECGCGTCVPMPPVAYNFTEEGNRIAFPSNFPYDQVLLRAYFEPDPKNLLIPLVAKNTFLYGVKAFAVEYDDKQPLWRIQLFDRRYEKGKEELFTLLNRISIGDVNKILNPHRCFP